MGDPTTSALATAPARTLKYGWNGTPSQANWGAAFDVFAYAPTTQFPTSLFGEDAITVPSGQRGYISSAYAFGARLQHMMVADLVWISTAVIDTVGTTSLTVGTLPNRDRNGGSAGVGLDLVAVHAVGATVTTSASTITASYTNSAGVSGRTATFSAINNGNSDGRVIVRASLQAGDVGVRSVESVTFGGTANGSSWHFALIRVLKYHPTGIPTDGGGAGGRLKTDPLSCLAEVFDGTVLWPISRGVAGSTSSQAVVAYDVKVV